LSLPMLSASASSFSSSKFKKPRSGSFVAGSESERNPCPLGGHPLRRRYRCPGLPWNQKAEGRHRRLLQ
jgi:hypothetical protein